MNILEKLKEKNRKILKLVEKRKAEEEFRKIKMEEQSQLRDKTK
jgi:hypothetical protein